MKTKNYPVFWFQRRICCRFYEFWPRQIGSTPWKSVAARFSFSFCVRKCCACVYNVLEKGICKSIFSWIVAGIHLHTPVQWPKVLHGRKLVINNDEKPHHERQAQERKISFFLRTLGASVVFHFRVVVRRSPLVNMAKRTCPISHRKRTNHVRIAFESPISPETIFQNVCTLRSGRYHQAIVRGIEA